ncbi:MAG: hypothetical protein AB9903_05615 [Vulcanimicrobiota bacterium]
MPENFQCILSATTTGANTVMNAITGDATPWFYLQASLFFREIYEFGALWHGVYWDEHEIIYSTRDRGLMARHFPKDQTFIEEIESWEWSKERPTSWKPTVIEDGKTISILYHT